MLENNERGKYKDIPKYREQIYTINEDSYQLDY